MASPSRHRLLAVLATVAVIWFVRAAAVVLMPLAFALFLVVLFDPLREWLCERMPDRVAVGVAFLVAAGVLGVFGWALSETLSYAITGLEAYGPQFESLRQRAEALPGRLPDESDLQGPLRRALSSVWSVAGAIVLVYALFALALAEVPHWGRKLRDRFDDPVSTAAVDTTKRVARQVQRFVVVQTATSVATGVLTGLFCWAMGLDLALLWGLLAGILNFIPTIGSIVSVVPPVVFAILQFGVGWQAPVVLVGIGLIQIVLGAYVDPKLQGRYLELSAFVVLVSITFWGWAWGIAGAFIAVPLTAAIVVALGEFEETEWVARLLTRDAPPAER
ncbi:AI-2E family transporter [Rubrivirga marina]|uniref:AI-2E family transporter n=1 Tax=Rubrivirga marina TaxID=1196024 RepID=A0A271J1I9_9BACT|nr:AI-2E family transporter [Rubrivirga marina]PAP77376.1 hypothetical protein BSZ37_13495 [Rubrivirga marina]